MAIGTSNFLQLTRPRMARLQRAAVLAAPGRIEIRRGTVPAPAANEVLVRVEGCGVCASNLSAFEGRENFDYPSIPGALGHEAWGRIEELGDDVDGLEIGQRVAMLSFRAYAEYDVAPATEVAVLPEALDEQPFPGEPLASAVNVFERCGIGPGDTVGIVGIGFMGALVTALAARAGARVIAISRRRSSLELAERMGAAETIQMGEHRAILEKIHRMTGGASCDCVVEAVGSQSSLDLATELTRHRGRLVIAGYHHDGMRMVNVQLWNWRGIDVVNAHERDSRYIMRAMRRAIQLVAAGRLDPSPLYTHILPLDELPQALQLVQERPEGFMKALIQP